MEARNAALTVEVAVVGGGPAGLTTAIALAAGGIETALISPPTRPDHRTTALLLGSVKALETLDIWPQCRSEAAALRVMRIVDDTDRLLRAPEIRFEAQEIGLDAFGYNLENRHLLAALEARALPTIARIEDEASAVEISEGRVSIALKGGGGVTARLAIGADGRRSLCRSAAGIESDSRDYPQTALTFNLAHSRAHRNISTEFHTPSGPFTLVPLPGQRSSLVYVAAPAAAEHLAGLDEAVLSD